MRVLDCRLFSVCIHMTVMNRILGWASRRFISVIDAATGLAAGAVPDAPVRALDYRTLISCLNRRDPDSSSPQRGLEDNHGRNKAFT